MVARPDTGPPLERTYYVEMGHIPVFVGFVFSERGYLREMKRLGISPVPEMLSATGHAATHFLQGPRGGRIALVVLPLERAETREAGANAVRGLLVHECVHAWQECERVMGSQDGYGSEVPAYTIQGMAQYGMSVYEKLSRGGRGGRRAGAARVADTAGKARKKRAK